MSIYLHFRAVAESEIRDDHTWLAAFMSDAWEDHSDEYTAGITCSINKGWDSVNDLYAAAAALGTDADEPWTLPIYGGRPVPHGADGAPSGPPLMLLEPAGVSQAAHFLTTVPFDELWKAVGPRFSGLGWTRQGLLGHHRDLQGFYERAASAGHAVAKAVWA